MDMDSVQRLITEGKELRERIIKIAQFNGSEQFKTLSDNMQMLLQAQEAIMTSYLAILILRIKN
jgi:hypothetical protein